MFCDVAPHCRGSPWNWVSALGVKKLEWGYRAYIFSHVDTIHQHGRWTPDDVVKIMPVDLPSGYGGPVWLFCKIRQVCGKRYDCVMCIKEKKWPFAVSLIALVDIVTREKPSPVLFYLCFFLVLVVLTVFCSITVFSYNISFS